MVQLDPAKDLAALFNPPQQERYSGFRYGQGTVLTWDPATFENTVSFRSLTLTNLPILGKIDGLSLKAGDVVGLMGWAPNGGFGAWWILGELGTPPLAEPVAVEGGANLLVRDGGSIIVRDDGSLIATDTVENRFVSINAGEIELGSISPEETIGFVRADDSTGTLRLLGENGVGVVGLNGNVNIQSLTGGVSLTTGTTGSSPNLHQGVSDALINRQTSARKYKQDIADLVVDPEATKRLRPRIWRDKGDVAKNPDTGRWNVGLIAEEVIEAGLPEFVEHDHEGNPDYVAYDRLCVALLALCRDQDRRLDALEDRVAALDGQQTDKPAVHPTKLPKRCDDAPLERERPQLEKPPPDGRRLTKDDLKKTENAKGGTT